MKGWKWPSKLGIQIWIIAVLVFVIWIVLQKPARWG
jgi:type IV secretory pathway TrbD component